MTIVDTSVWVEHFASHNQQLEQLLGKGQALIHDFVVGELAAGHLKDRERTLQDLKDQPRVDVAMHYEVLHLLEIHKLSGSGLGWVDLHLLAAAKLSGSLLLTLDRNLDKAARRLRVAATSHAGIQ